MVSKQKVMVLIMKIILGSYSARRKEILGYFSLPFIQKGSDFDERSIPYENDPHDYATKISEAKNQAICDALPPEDKDAIIITADSVVTMNGEVFNKPRDKEEAHRFLSLFSGNWHTLITAMSVSQNGKILSCVEKTKILFNKLTPEQIDKYHSRFYFQDMAGGFAVEKTGSIVVSQFNGCYYNIMGMPINTLRKLLLEYNIDLWDYLKDF